MRSRTLRPRPPMTPPAWWDAVALRDGAPPPGAARQRRGLLARAARIAPRLVLIAAVALLLGALAIFAFRAAFADRIYPAVVAGDVDLGGMTVDEATVATRQRADAVEGATVSFRSGDRTWEPTFRELGATVDVDATVADAYALGRDDNAVSRLDFAAELLQGDQTVPLRVSVDRDALDAWFDRVDADIGHPAIDAAIRVEGTEVSVSPEASGTVVDREAATAVVLETIASLRPAAVELPTRVQQPRVTAADLDAPAASLRTALSSPVVVTFDGRKWDLAPADLAPFVRVDVRPGGDRPEIQLTLARDELAAWLRETLSGEVNRSPVDARVAWSAADGLVVLEPSVDGAAMRPDALAELVETGFFARTGPVEVPAVMTKPEIDDDNLAALKIEGLLARGDSNYGDLNIERDTNIEVATGYLNGTLVPPGE